MPDNQRQTAASFSVDGKVALSSFIALSDAHLQKMLHGLQELAVSEKALAGDWSQIADDLARLSQDNIPALIWYALPDGSYHAVGVGKAQGNLKQRAYWPRLMQGNAVIGDLVVSTQTGKPVAIIAVPVLRPDKTVVAVIGTSVYLDKLSKIISEEMGLSDNLIFYSFDASPLIGLHSDESLIFYQPYQEGSREVKNAFDDMIAHKEGSVSYLFHGRKRTLLYRTSSFTGWWHAFGILNGN